MKQKLLFFVLIIGIAAIASAQVRDRNQHRPAVETVTVTGNLIVAHGMPAIKSGDVTYIVSGINRLVGFIDGLKEGAQVSIEGIALANPRNETLKFLRLSKLTIGGKTYDLAPPEGFSMGGWWMNPRDSMRYPAPRALPQRPYMPNRRGPFWRNM
ncbi:MAG: hypothetical protein LBH42_09445 [Treponema sp.]|nr:hypothetical protein [Treponema sp.]